MQRYATFETKYEDRKDRNGEIKSTMFSQKQFKHGFASMNKHNAKFVDDFLTLFDEDVHIYFSVGSKIEYLVSQLFRGYRNSMFNWNCIKNNIGLFANGNPPGINLIPESIQTIWLYSLLCLIL